MSAVSRLNAVDTVTPVRWTPSMLATPEQVRALLAADLDPVTREHLQQRLHDQLNPPKRDPFAGVVQADYSAEEAF